MTKHSWLILSTFPDEYGDLKSGALWADAICVGRIVVNEAWEQLGTAFVNGSSQDPLELLPGPIDFHASPLYDALKAMASNQMDISLRCAHTMPPPPFFASATADMHMKSVECVVELVVKTIAESPDYQAGTLAVDELPKYESSWEATRDKFRYASNSHAALCSNWPVETEYKGHNVAGVLFLTSPLANDRFNARIVFLVPNSICLELSPGMALCRTSSYQSTKVGKVVTLSSVIARVVDVNPIC